MREIPNIPQRLEQGSSVRARMVEQNLAAWRTPPSEPAITSSEPKGRDSRWALTLAPFAIPLLMTACSGKPTEVPPTPTPRSTATPVGIGGEVLPKFNPEIDTIAQRIAAGEEVDEQDILKFNAAVEEARVKAQATATAEAQKPTPTATPEKSGKPELPSDAPQAVKQIFAEIEALAPNFASPEAAKELQRKIAETAAIPNDVPGPGGENVRQGSRYASQVFGDLLALYYFRRDPKILALAQEVRAFIKKEFPLFYAAGERDGIWRIQGE